MPTLGAILAALISLSCSRHAPSGTSQHEERTQDAALTGAVTSLADAGPALELVPLTGYGWLHELRENDTVVGYVSVPLGAMAPRPLMVALHGGGDRPEWACGEWRGVTNAYPFIVCPKGPGNGSLYWSTPVDTKARVARAIEATRRTFDAYVSDGPIVLAGFSLGASQAAALAREDPSAYPLLVLAEGAYDVAPQPAFDGAFAKGGHRVLFVCTTLGVCEPTYTKAANELANRGISVRVNVAGTNRHGMWDAVVRSVRRDWPWLVEGAPGWASYLPPKEEAPLPGKTIEVNAR